MHKLIEQSFNRDVLFLHNSNVTQADGQDLLTPPAGTQTEKKKMHNICLNI